jgi:hypothetical protein
VQDGLDITRIKKYFDLAVEQGCSDWPLIISSDCTKVQPNVTFSTIFCAHIIGTIRPLSEMEVKTPDDIDRIIKEIIENREEIASQARFVMIAVWNLPISIPSAY